MPIRTSQPVIETPSAPTVSGGTALLGVAGQPDSLNPVMENNPALYELTPLLFDTLLKVDPQTAHLKPGLAQQWKYDDKGKRVTFQLYPDLKWSNGVPITAADIADSLKAIRHPALLNFTDIKALDNKRLVFTFDTLNCAAITTLTQLPIIPAAEITATVPTGSGSFMVSNWSDDKRTLSLTANPNYYGTTPLLDGLIIRFLQYDDITVALSEGDFDAIGALQTKISLPNATTYKDITYPAPQIIYLAINFDPKNDKPLSPKVREALTLALDREAILAEALGGDGQLSAGSLLPEHWAATSEKLSPPSYDPQEARSLLTKAGLRDTNGDGWLELNGKRLSLSIRVNGEDRLHQNLGWLISGYYRDLGLFARAEGVSFESVVDDLFSHDFRLAIFSLLIQPDPDQQLYWGSAENRAGFGLNFTSYRNPRLDRLFNKAVSIPGCEYQARAEQYNKIQQILAREQPVDFLLVPNRHIIVNKRLFGLKPGPFAGLTWNVNEWYLIEK